MILRAFFASLRDICLFRRGPEDMPYSPPLLIGLLLGCGVLLSWFNVHNGANARLVTAALAGGLGVVGMVYLLLRGRGKPERFVQTMTALASVYLLLGVAADLLVVRLNLRALVMQALKHPNQPPPLTGLQSLLLLGFSALGIWEFCASVGIVRRALEVPLAGAVLVLFLMVMADWFVAGLVLTMLGAG